MTDDEIAEMMDGKDISPEEFVKVMERTNLF